MYSRITLARHYLQYWIKGANSKGHGIHSPFVYRFVKEVLNDKSKDEVFEKAEKLRKTLRKDHTVLTIDDFGAGSAANASDKRTVASIAANAAKPKKYGQLLARMVRYFQPQTVIELGTSLGITTAYLSLAAPQSHITTMEGASAVAAVARNNFKKLGLTNINIVEGNFDQTLENVLQQNPSPGFVFVDGNHRREPTERYFLQLLNQAGNDTVIVFDDIHWSSEMEQAWSFIKAHEAVTCSIDLFFIGIVFLRKEFKEKEHFVIRF